MAFVINSEVNSPNSAGENSWARLEGSRRGAREAVKGRKKRGKGNCCKYATDMGFVIQSNGGMRDRNRDGGPER